MSFHFITWLAYFYTYCIVGWAFESSYVSICTKRPVNRGFMKGPWLPIYGSGAIVMLLATTPLESYPVAVYFAGAFAATALELVTGELMLRIFKVRYWDYSSHKVQFRGHICLSSSVAWGFFAMLLLYVINKPVEKFYAMWNEELLTIVMFLVTLVFVYDFTVSLREALDLRALIIQAEELTKKLAESAEEKKEELLSAIEEKKDELAEAAEEKKEQLITSAEETREKLTAGYSEAVHRAEETREKLAEEYSEAKRRSEEKAEARMEKLRSMEESTQEAFDGMKARFAESQKEAEERLENLRTQMANHSRQLLIHNPTSRLSIGDMINSARETEEVRKRIRLRDAMKRQKNK